MQSLADIGDGRPVGHPPLRMTHLVVLIARRIDEALSRQADFASECRALTTIAPDRATRTLWSCVVRDTAPVTQILNVLRGGAIQDKAAARQALLIIVCCDGWRRLKECDQSGCAEIFVDATVGAIRRRCSVHTRARQSRSP